MEVLIVKIGAIGDAVMALGAVHWLRVSDPTVRITWLAGKKIVPLLKTAGGIDRIVSVDEEALFCSSRLDSLKALLSVWCTLFWKKFDLVVLGHADWRYRLLTLSVLSQETRMFVRKNGKLFPVPGRYHGDEYLRLVSRKEDWTMPPFIFPPTEVPGLSPFLAKSLGHNKEKPRILLVPGGAKNVLADDRLRRWPIQSYVALAKALAAKGYKVILAGSETDLWVREWFRDVDVVDSIGTTDLSDLIAMISRVEVVVSHDSGPLHLAVLLQKRVVALFGPTNPNEKIPRQESNPAYVLWQGKVLPCVPCYDGKGFARCERNVCMEMISVPDVEEAIVQLLS